MMNFKGLAKRITGEQISSLAFSYRLEEASLRAFMEVESSGKGFDSEGRPKMLYEPHIFFKLLRGQPEAQNKAVTLGIAYKKWGTMRYPLDSYPRLVKAMSIDKDKALQSASWGLSQILGLNFKTTGFDSVEDMVTKFMESEYNHILGMLRFLERNKIIDHLRNHNWAEVARGYNGPSYTAHGYHTKLETAYKKHKKI